MSLASGLVVILGALAFDSRVEASNHLLESPKSPHYCDRQAGRTLSLEHVFHTPNL